MTETSDICRDCKMCCNGTLFSKVRVSDDERRKVGEECEYLVDPENTLYMKLGCAHLCDTGCGIYEQRPLGCRDYHCNLLKFTLNGDISHEHAVELIKQLHAMFSKLQKTCQRLMPTLTWPYLLVGRGELSRLLQLHANQGGKLKKIDLWDVQMQQRAIMQFIRLYLDNRFMQDQLRGDVEGVDRQLAVERANNP